MITSPQASLFAIAIYYRQEKIVQKLLKWHEDGNRENLDIQAMYKGRTPLEWALSRANSKMAPAEKEKWKNIADRIWNQIKKSDIQNLSTLFAAAACYGETDIVEKLLNKYKANINFNTIYVKDTALVQVMTQGRNHENQADEEAWLHIAKKIWGIIRENNTIPTQENLLAAASYLENLEIVDDLLKWDEELDGGFIDFKAEYNDGTAFEHVLYIEKYRDKPEEEKNAWTRIVENMFYTIKLKRALSSGKLLAAAAYCKRIEWIEELLTIPEGIDTTMTCCGETAMSLILEGKDNAVEDRDLWCKILKKIFYAMKSTGALNSSESLAAAVFCGCSAAVQELLAQNDVNFDFEAMYEGYTALHWALRNAWKEETSEQKMWKKIADNIFETMISRNVIKREDRLAAAACCRYARVVRDLLDKNEADLDFNAEYGTHFVTGCGHETDSALGWALFWACPYPFTNSTNEEQKEWGSISKRIIKIMKDKNVVSAKQDLLCMTVYTQDTEMVNMLLDWDIIVDKKFIDSDGWMWIRTAWEWAMRYKESGEISTSEKAKWAAILQRFQQAYS